MKINKPILMLIFILLISNVIYADFMDDVLSGPGAIAVASISDANFDNTKYEIVAGKWYTERNGVLITNKWMKKRDGRWSYIGEDGFAVNGTKEIGGDIYHFDGQGNMLTFGRVNYNGYEYDIGSDGKLILNQSAKERIDKFNANSLDPAASKQAKIDRENAEGNLFDDPDSISQKSALEERITNPAKRFGNGNTVVYGKTRNGVNIEWDILKYEGNKALLICKYSIVTRAFDTNDKNATWENSTLRKWLNDDYYNHTFTDEEKKYICNTNVQNANAETTIDKLFVLSKYEAETYLPNPTDRWSKICDYTENKEPYDHSLSKGKNQLGATYGNTSWWLRSSSNYKNEQCLVNMRGLIARTDDRTSIIHAKPAMWVFFNEPDDSLGTSIDVPAEAKESKEDIYKLKEY